MHHRIRFDLDDQLTMVKDDDFRHIEVIMTGKHNKETRQRIYLSTGSYKTKAVGTTHTDVTLMENKVRSSITFRIDNKKLPLVQAGFLMHIKEQK